MKSKPSLPLRSMHKDIHNPNNNVRQFPHSLIFAMLLVSFEIAIYLSSDAYLPALPIISKELDIPQNLAQLTITAWFLGASSLQLFLGPITEYTGRRTIIILGGLLFLFSTISCIMSQSIYSLIIFRMFQGATLSTVAVAGYATIHDIFDRIDAIYILSIMASLMILAPTFGPLIGAVILFFGSWQHIFIMLAIWASFSILGLYLYMPESIHVQREKIDMTIAIREYKAIITNKNFIKLLVLSRCLFGAMITWVFASPFLLISEYNFSTEFYAIIQAVIFGSYIFATKLLRTYLTHLGLAKTIIIGISTSFIASALGTISAILYPFIIWNIIICMIILTFGAGLSFSILSRLAIESSDETMSSKVAMKSFLTCIISALASAAISTFYNNSIISLSIILCFFTTLALVFFYISYDYLKNEISN